PALGRPPNSSARRPVASEPGTVITRAAASLTRSPVEVARTTVTEPVAAARRFLAGLWPARRDREVLVGLGQAPLLSLLERLPPREIDPALPVDLVHLDQDLVAHLDE